MFDKMLDIMREAISWMFPLMYIILIVLAAIRKRLRAKFLLIAYLAGNVILSLIWRIPRLLFELHVIEVETFWKFNDWFGIPLNILNILVICLLIPYILLAPVPKRITERPPANRPI
ncbi:MAG: hypothetical protein JW715_02055 [Sedimentisphaerales bacterium]|nr:hypothetical protein [Sedimentisphaerales bacterium]